MRIAVVLFAYCLTVFCATGLCLIGPGAAVAAAGVCTINGKPGEQVQLFNRPAGHPSSTMKSGTTVVIQGGGHDTQGRTWSFVLRQGGFVGWILRSGLSCF